MAGVPHRPSSRLEHRYQSERLLSPPSLSQPESVPPIHSSDGNHRCADNASIITKLSWHQHGPRLKHRCELVEVLSDTAVDEVKVAR
jgi:hypothetical protein